MSNVDWYRHRDLNRVWPNLNKKYRHEQYNYTCLVFRGSEPSTFDNEDVIQYTPYEDPSLANQNSRKLGGIWPEVGGKPLPISLLF